MARLGTNQKPVREFNFDGWLEDVDQQQDVSDNSSTDKSTARLNRTLSKAKSRFKNMRRSISNLSRSNLKLLCEKLASDTASKFDDVPLGGVENTPPVVLKKSLKKMNKLVKYQREMEHRGHGVMSTINIILSDLEEQSLDIDNKLEAMRMDEEINLCKETETDVFGPNVLLQKSREDLPRPEDNPEELSDSSEESDWQRQSCEDDRDALAMPVSDLIYLIKAMRIQHSINPSLTTYYDPPDKKVFLDKEALKQEVIVLRHKQEQFVSSNQIIKDALLASHHLAQRVACWMQSRLKRLRLVEEEKTLLQETFTNRITILDKDLRDCTENNEKLEYELSSVVAERDLWEEQYKRETTELIDHIKLECSNQTKKCNEVEEDLARVLKKLEKEEASKAARKDPQSKIQKDLSNSLARETFERKRLEKELVTASEKIEELEMELSKQVKRNSDYNHNEEFCDIVNGDKDLQSREQSVASDAKSTQLKAGLYLANHISRYERLLMFIEDVNSEGYSFNDSDAHHQLQMLEFSAEIPELSGNEVLDYIASLFHSTVSDRLQKFHNLAVELHGAASGTSSYRISVKEYRSLITTQAHEFVSELQSIMGTLRRTVLQQVNTMLVDVSTLREEIKTPATLIDVQIQTDSPEEIISPINCSVTTQTDELDSSTDASVDEELPDQQPADAPPEPVTSNAPTTSLAFFLSSTENVGSEGVISEALAIQKYFGEIIRYLGPLLTSFHITEETPHEPTEFDPPEYLLKACLGSLQEMAKVSKKTPGSLLFPQFMTVAQKLKAVRIASGNVADVVEDAFITRQRDAASRKAGRQEAKRDAIHNAREATFVNCVAAEENPTSLAGVVQKLQQQQQLQQQGGNLLKQQRVQQQEPVSNLPKPKHSEIDSAKRLHKLLRRIPAEGEVPTNNEEEMPEGLMSIFDRLKKLPDKREHSSNTLGTGMFPLI